MKVGLSYADVAMVPKYNNIASRTLPSVATQATKKTRMGIPIFAANMDTIIGPKMAESLVAVGSIPIFHRFYKDKTALVDLVRKYEGNCYISYGASDLGELFTFLSEHALQPKGVCVDIAHGHSIMVEETIKRIRDRFETLEIIAGNVCSPEAVMDLVHWGADAIKVGIGPGSACTTRTVTAFGAPQFTAVQECAEVAKKFKVPIIADGGIRGSRELILALAAGASSVMIGGYFAESEEAYEVGRGLFRGQASQAFQNDYFGGVKAGTCPEGVSKVVRLASRCTVVEMINEELLAGLRSGMTYCGAKSIPELQEKAEFVQITPAYWS